MEQPKFETPSPENGDNGDGVLDEKWHGRLEEAGTFQDYEYFRGDKDHRGQQKKQFLAGEIENPDLDHQIDLVEMDGREEKLLALKQDLLAEEENEVVRQAYRWRINEKIAELRMIRATANGEMRRFKKYNEFIYGKPDEQVFYWEISNLRKKAEKNLSSGNSDLEAAAQDLIETLANIPEPEISQAPEPPTDESFQKAKDLVEERLAANLIELGDENPTLNPDQVAEMFDQGLEQIGAKEMGWKVIKIEGRLFGVIPKRKEVEVPDAKDRKLRNAVNLYLHEVDWHVGRKLTGLRSKFKLLGFGLDRGLKGDEGGATMVEQGFKGKFNDFAGRLSHTVAGFAYGYGDQPRNFREAFEITKKYLYMNQLGFGKDKATADRLATTNAYGTCVRTFKGTDCATAGTCHTRDITYREGNIGVWDVIGKNPDELKRFRVGLYDPANQRHIWILEQLGITDKDLENLEK